MTLDRPTKQVSAAHSSEWVRLGEQERVLRVNLRNWVQEAMAVDAFYRQSDRPRPWSLRPTGEHPCKPVDGDLVSAGLDPEFSPGAADALVASPALNMSKTCLTTGAVTLSGSSLARLLVPRSIIVLR